MKLFLYSLFSSIFPIIGICAAEIQYCSQTTMVAVVPMAWRGPISARILLYSKGNDLRISMALDYSIERDYRTFLVEPDQLDRLGGNLLDRKIELEEIDRSSFQITLVFRRNKGELDTNTFYVSDRGLASALEQTELLAEEGGYLKYLVENIMDK